MLTRTGVILMRWWTGINYSRRDEGFLVNTVKECHTCDSNGLDVSCNSKCQILRVTYSDVNE